MREALARILLPERNIETLAWWRAVISDGGSVSNQRVLIVDKLVSTLKGTGVWSKLDRLWLFAAENSQSALRDIVAASQAAGVNAPTFTVDRGYAGNGTSSYVNSQFVPSSAGGKMTLNSSHISVRSRTSLAANASTTRLIGCAAGATPRTLLRVRSIGDVIDAIINSTNAASTASNASTLGHFVGNRSDSSNHQYYKDGSSLGAGTTASSALADSAITFGADPLTGGAAFSTAELASGSCGSSLSSGDVAALVAAELTYMKTIGAA